MDGWRMGLMDDYGMRALGKAVLNALDTNVGSAFAKFGQRSNTNLPCMQS